MDFASFPPPPPWFYNSMTNHYENQITGEQSQDHPLKRFFTNKTNNNSLDNSIKDNDELTLNIGSPESKRVTININEQVKNNNNNNANTNNVLIQESSFIPNKVSKYNDFHCHWKELGLFGDINSYGLTIRYNIEDGSSVVKFDGVDAKWYMNVLEGPYGPIERWDLFIGAKVRIFGRHLSITSANASVCHWNDVQAKKLMKKQEWLRQKIESVGAVPVVRRQVPVSIKNIVRASKAEGRTDLRRLFNENTKLYEQLTKLGLAGTITEKTLEKNSIATEKYEFNQSLVN